MQKLLNRLFPVDSAAQVLYYVNDALIVTFSALIFTFPIILGAYGRLSLAAPLTNLLSLPVQPFIMSWGEPQHC